LQRDPSAMTPAELCCTRERLGLTLTELATVLGLDARVAPPSADEPALARTARKHRALTRRSVYRWERGTHELSPANAEAFTRLIRYTDDAVQALVDTSMPGQPIVTYTEDDDLHRAEPDLWPSLPAAWHRAVASRAAERIPGARVAYRD
jgi:transcriptional regulator with XRE-family HTH domain